MPVNVIDNNILLVNCIYHEHHITDINLGRRFRNDANYFFKPFSLKERRGIFIHQKTSHNKTLV